MMINNVSSLLTSRQPVQSVQGNFGSKISFYSISLMISMCRNLNNSRYCCIQCARYVSVFAEVLMKAGTVCLLVSLCYPDPTIQAVQSPARKLMMCRARGWLAKIIGKLSQSLLLLATQTLWLSIRGAQETWVLAVPLLLLTENKRLYLSTSLSVPFFFAASFGQSC